MNLLIKYSANDCFELKMVLNVNFDIGYVDVHVSLLNKVNNRKQSRFFDANKLGDALKYYEQQERMFIKA